MAARFNFFKDRKQPGCKNYGFLKDKKTQPGWETYFLKDKKNNHVILFSFSH